jgi:hypothetical protein
MRSVPFDLETRSSVETVVVRVLLALAILLSLYEFAYGTWAVAWNLRRSPPSYGGAALSTLLALAAPVAFVAAWRNGRRRGLPTWHVLSQAAAICVAAGIAVGLLLGLAAAMTGI